jgi:RNA-directed DNA polymerase
MTSATFEAIYHAWCACRRRKRKTPQAQNYEVNLLDNLMGAVQALSERRWRPSPPVCFVVSQPKGREVHAAQFADRVIHHYLVPQLEPLFENVFIYDVYSNRKNKGAHAAVNRLQAFMRSLQGGDYKAPVSEGPYYLQLDIASFFNSIDRPLLFQMIQKRLRQTAAKQQITQQKAEELRWLTHVILKQDVAAQSRLIASESEYQRVPPHKRMINAGEGKALPIGNLTSQLFANVYLNPLDQFIKHTLKCRHYIRYVDDMILLHNDRGQLLEWLGKIERYLNQELGLQLRQPRLLRPISDGADFLGYIVRPHYRLVRRRVVDNLWQRLVRFERQIVNGSYKNGWRLALRADDREPLRSVLASYLGHFSHANSYHLQQRLWQRFQWLLLLFWYDAGRLLPRWEPRSVAGFRGQCYYFQRQYPLACVRIQKGWQYESLPALSNKPELSSSSLFNRVVAVVVREEGYLAGGLKRRCYHQLSIQPGVKLCGV